MKNYLKKTTQITQVVLTTAIAVLFTSCGPTEKEKLRAEVDSLRSELQINQQMAQKLNEIGILMDSIDANRQTLRLNVVEGIAKDDYVNRMEGLKNYVRSTEDKIQELESTLKKSKSSNRAFSVALKNLKAEIEFKNQEIASLTETVNKYKAENDNLVKIKETQGLDILDKLQQIETKKQEIASLEQKIEEVSTKSKEAIASGYLAHAKTVEKIAEKIKLAPKKKKATLTESLELYRKAALYGSIEAKTEIERIETELQ